MNLSELFIRRPVMTTLVMLSLLLFGLIAYHRLPISNLPSVDFPTISVTANLPGANPEIIDSSITNTIEKIVNGVAGIDHQVRAVVCGDLVEAHR